MAKFSDSASIGSKYGTSVEDIGQAMEGTAEQIIIDWSNEGIDLMRQQIINNSRVKGQSTLAQSFSVEVVGSTIQVVTTDEYARVYDYIDKGVRGVFKNKAPKSPYKFRNLGTSKEMINSFKGWAATAGITNVKGTTTSYKGKNKKKAVSDQDKAAKTLATWTKIGGIKPKNFISKAVNKKRVDELATTLSKALSQTITLNIVNGNNNS
jgi:hypothetical protein